MHVNSAENMGHNLPLLQFSMTGPPPQVHHNNHQQNVTENIQVNQTITLSVIAQINPYLLHSLQHQCLHLRTRSMYHKMEKETGKTYDYDVRYF